MCQLHIGKRDRSYLRKRHSLPDRTWHRSSFFPLPSICAELKACATRTERRRNAQLPCRRERLAMRTPRREELDEPVAGGDSRFEVIRRQLSARVGDGRRSNGVWSGKDEG